MATFVPMHRPAVAGGGRPATSEGWGDRERESGGLETRWSSVSWARRHHNRWVCVRACVCSRVGADLLQQGAYDQACEGACCFVHAAAELGCAVGRLPLKHLARVSSSHTGFGTPRLTPERHLSLAARWKGRHHRESTTLALRPRNVRDERASFVRDFCT